MFSLIAATDENKLTATGEAFQSFTNPSDYYDPNKDILGLTYSGLAEVAGSSQSLEFSKTYRWIFRFVVARSCGVQVKLQTFSPARIPTKETGFFTKFMRYSPSFRKKNRFLGLMRKS